MANELSKDIQTKINCYQTIETEGYKLYPIRVKHYSEFAIARSAIAFVQQTLPIEYMSLPLLSAFYKMDYESAAHGVKGAGYFGSTLIAIALALRLCPDDEPIERMLIRFQPYVDQDDPSRLKGVRFIVDGMEEKILTPVQFARLRKIIAEQNGIELASDLDNPELLQAEMDLAEANGPKVDFHVYDLVSAAATIFRMDEAEIYEWPILKLTRRLESVRRMIDYTICGIAESQGTTWKGGNPRPHPWLAKAKDGSSSALISMNSFLGGRGLQAMQNAGVETSV